MPSRCRRLMAMLALVALVVLAFVAGVADRGNQNLTLYYNPGTESSVCRRQREAAAEMSAAAYRMRQAAREQMLAAEAAERAATAKQKEWEAKQELEAKKRQTMIIRIAQAAVGLAGLKVLTAMRQTFIEFQRAQKQAYMNFLREQKKKKWTKRSWTTRQKCTGGRKPTLSLRCSPMQFANLFHWRFLFTWLAVISVPVSTIKIIRMP